MLMLIHSNPNANADANADMMLILMLMCNERRGLWRVGVGSGCSGRPVYIYIRGTRGAGGPRALPVCFAPRVAQAEQPVARAVTAVEYEARLHRDPKGNMLPCDKYNNCDTAGLTAVHNVAKK